MKYPFPGHDTTCECRACDLWDQSERMWTVAVVLGVAATLLPIVVMLGLLIGTSGQGPSTTPPPAPAPAPAPPSSWQ